MCIKKETVGNLGSISRASATNKYRHQVCFALLQAGADKALRDSNGDTSQHLAESRQRDKIALLLNDWRPIGLTATQTHKIKESRGEGPMRCEVDAEYGEVQNFLKKMSFFFRCKRFGGLRRRHLVSVAGRIPSTLSEPPPWGKRQEYDSYSCYCKCDTRAFPVPPGLAEKTRGRCPLIRYPNSS